MATSTPTRTSDEQQETTSSVQIESSREEQRNQHPRDKVVIVRYLLLSMIAVGMTVTCPGETVVRSFQLAVTCVGTLVAFFALQGSNPGYLTDEIMAAVDVEEDVGLLEGGDNDVEIEDVKQSTDRKRRGSSKDLDPLASNEVNDNEDDDSHYHGTRRKVCPICHFAPPLRSHYCKKCDKCVATFDHHCIFLGTCIGERNHCRFWWFLGFQTAAFWVSSGIVASSSLGLTTFFTSGASMDAARVVLAKVYLYPLTACSVIMLVIHSAFALVNSTTFECTKGSRLEYLKGATDSLVDLPFSKKSVRGNLHLFCCHRDAVCSPATASWSPIVWKPPGKIIRDSEDWWEHPLQNKYWTCC
jgi:hypothetical protein